MYHNLLGQYGFSNLRSPKRPGRSGNLPQEPYKGCKKSASIVWPLEWQTAGAPRVNALSEITGLWPHMEMQPIKQNM